MILPVCTILTTDSTYACTRGCGREILRNGREVERGKSGKLGRKSKERNQMRTKQRESQPRSCEDQKELKREIKRERDREKEREKERKRESQRERERPHPGQKIQYSHNDTASHQHL